MVEVDRDQLLLGVGEHGALERGKALRTLPGRDRTHLLFAEALLTQGLAMLGEDELTAPGKAGPGLSEFAEPGIEPALRALVEDKARDRVAKDVGDQGEDRPPVPGSSGRGPGLGDGVARPE